MKKIYLFIAALSLIGNSLQSQTVLTYNAQSVLAGTSHDFIFMENKEEGPAGANVTWDFSDLKPTEKTLTSHMLNSAALEKADEIKDANVAIEEFGNYFLFKVTENSIEQYGTVSCNTVIKYDQPFLKLKFPFAYGDIASGNYSGIQQSANSKVAVLGTYEIKADAYGTLILPGNISIKDVLRVKQTRTIEDKSSKITEITYRWYTDNLRYPLLVVVKYVTSKETYVSQTAMYAHAGDRNKNATLINDLKNEGSFSVYPSPYNDNLTVDYTLAKASNVKIDMYDMSGKLAFVLLHRTMQDAGNHTILVSNEKYKIRPGIYYVQLSIENAVLMRKVVKQ